MNLSLQNYRLPGNKIAYSFSDAASSNACLAMFEINKQLGKDGFLFSNRSNFSNEYKELIQINLSDFELADVDCLFTGTSHPDSSELYEVNFIKKAHKKGVKIISFIDHWINFKLRFTGLSKNELPHEIWVIDENAKRLAIEDGLPSEVIKIKGNPYHFFLGNIWKPKFEDKQYLTTIDIPEKRFHVLFAPDPFSIRELYKKTGFTETKALKDIIPTLRNIKNVFLIIKTHPLQPKDCFEEILNEYPNLNFKILSDADVPELLLASDLVIGFHSNILLEAKALNKKVIRFFPGNIEADLLNMSTQIDKASISVSEFENLILSFVHE